MINNLLGNVVYLLNLAVIEVFVVSFYLVTRILIDKLIHTIEKCKYKDKASDDIVVESENGISITNKEVSAFGLKILIIILLISGSIVLLFK